MNETMKLKSLALLFSVVFFLVGCGGSEEAASEGAPAITGGAVAIQEPDPEPEPIPEEPEPEIVTVKLCHDTDRGYNQWEAGKIFGFYDNAQKFEFVDECKNNNFVVEYYCEDENPKQDLYLCRHGCVDSACR